MKAQDVDSLLDFLDKAPAAREAHPRTEHFAPLFVTLGAAYESGGLDNQQRHRRLLVRPVEALLAVLLRACARGIPASHLAGNSPVTPSVLIVWVPHTRDRGSEPPLTPGRGRPSPRGGPMPAPGSSELVGVSRVYPGTLRNRANALAVPARAT